MKKFHHELFTNSFQLLSIYGEIKKYRKHLNSYSYVYKFALIVCSVTSSLHGPVGAISLVVVKVGAVDRRLALLAVDKVVRGDGLRHSFGSPRYSPKDDDYV